MSQHATHGPNCLTSISSQLDRCLLFHRGSPFSFLCSPVPFSYFSLFKLPRARKLYRQVDSLRYCSVDFNKENQFWLCLWNQPTLNTHTRTSSRAIYHPQEFHQVLFAVKGKKSAWNGSWKPSPYSIRNCCAVAQLCISISITFSPFSCGECNIQKMWLNLWDLSNTLIHIVVYILSA